MTRRPAAKPKEQTVPFVVRLKPEELEAVRSAAAAERRSMASYARSRLLGTAERAA